MNPTANPRPKPRSHGEGVVAPNLIQNMGQNVVIEAGVRIFNPENIHLGNGIYIGHDSMLIGYHQGLLKIASGAWIGPRCYLHAAGGIYIGEKTGIGPDVRILTSIHEADASLGPVIEEALSFAPVEIGPGCDIGLGAILLPGVKIGMGAVVGAGSVVTREIPPYEIWAGVPARKIRVRQENQENKGPGYFVHPTAIVEPDVHIGFGAAIWHHCHLRSGCHIGAGTSMGKNVYVDPGVILGENCKIQNNVSLYRGLTVGNGVFLGPSSVFTNDLYARAGHWNDERLTSTRLENGVTIGANATIICGIHIGAFATIGAGAVVTHDVPAHHLIYGVPATMQGFVCECGMKLPINRFIPGEYGCHTCQMRFILDGTLKLTSIGIP